MTKVVSKRVDGARGIFQNQLLASSLLKTLDLDCWARVNEQVEHVMSNELVVCNEQAEDKMATEEVEDRMASEEVEDMMASERVEDTMASEEVEDMMASERVEDTMASG